MKHLNYLLSLLLLLSLSVTDAAAKIVYGVGDQMTTTPEIGKNYLLLASGGKGTYHYLDGTSGGGSTSITDKTVFQFVDAGDFNGEQSYYLYQPSTNTYICNNLDEVGDVSFDGSASLHAMTNDKELAFRFTMGKGVGESTDSASIWFYRKTSAYWKDNMDFTEDAFILANVGGKRTQHLCGCDWGFFLALYTDTNLFQIFDATELTGYEKLRAYYQTITDPAESFTSGESAGCVPPAIYDAAVQAYADIDALLESTEVSEVDANNAVDKMDEALKAAKEAVIPMKEGYYYIGQNKLYPSNALCASGANLTWKSNIELPSATTATQYVFQVEKASDSTFYIKNTKTGTYVGDLKRNSSDCIPMTDTPTADYIIAPNKEYFHITRVGYSTGIHAQGGGNAVPWNYTTDASQWKFIEVPQDSLTKILELAKQDQLNTALNEAYDKANKSYSSSRVYKDISKDNVYGDNTLIADETKIWSNAPYNTEDQTDGNGYPALVNQTIDQPGDYFHSDWRSSRPEGYHDLEMELSKPVSSVIFKTSRRITDGNGLVDTWKAGWLSYPTQLTVYASNDEGEEKNWKEFGVLNLNYFNDTTTISNPVQFDAEYKYVRTDVTKTKTMESNPAAQFFYVSEFGVYEPVLDEAASPYLSVTEAVRTTFENALKTAETELNNGKATQATIDALTQAYKDFIAQYADPQVAIDEVAEARNLVENAVAGTEPGYTTDEAISNLKTVTDAEEAKIKTVMSMDVLKEISTNLQNAKDAFLKTIVQPTPGKMYYLVSRTSEVANGNAIYTQNNASGAQMKWGGAADGVLNTDSINDYPGFFWVVETADNDSVYLRNIGTGFYMDNNTTASEPSKVYLKYAAAGVFNLVVNNTNSKYINIQPSSHNVVTWMSASGNDNSAISFEPISINVNEATFYHEIAEDVAPQFMTLPYKVVGTDNGTMYTVVGIKEDKLILSETSEVEAGEPFVFVANEDAGAFGQFYPVADGENVATLTEGKNVNGVVGTIGKAFVRAGLGILKEGQIGLTKGTKNTIAPNSAYLLPEIPVTTEDGDLQITIVDAITAVKNALAGNNNHLYFDLQGRRVVAPAKGLYITNGKKIYVK